MALRRHTDGKARLELPEDTVGECLAELERRFPGLRGELRDDDGRLASAVNLYVNGQDVRYLSSLETPLGADDELTILLPVAGGEAGVEFQVLSAGC